MLPAFEIMYSDAMIAEELKYVQEDICLLNFGDAISKWEVVSKKIESLIPRVAQVNFEAGKELLACWKYAREERNDPRELSMRIESKLVPELLKSFSLLYNPINIQDSEYIFEKTDIGFITIKDSNTHRYLHSPLDPMNEARCLAEMIYDPRMGEFHIWGCGLGYLAYQIWEMSQHSVKIYIYEEDSSVIEYAKNIGVLSYIDEDFLSIVNSTDIDSMIRTFISASDNSIRNKYISDWKVGAYKDHRMGSLLDSFDFNARTRYSHKSMYDVNIRKNRELVSKTIEELPADLHIAGSEIAIVSAGPSLNDNIDFLRINRQRIRIIAINTAIKRLAGEGIKPDIVAILDPKASLISHIAGNEDFASDIPLVMTLNSSWTFAHAYRGPIYIINNYDKTEDGFIWNFGGTVASLALDLAYYLQAGKIYLIGSDLAFSQNRNYADGTVHKPTEAMNNNIPVESTDGGKVFTTHLYNKYREIIQEQISEHPDVTVINMAKHGAKIDGTVTLLE